MSSVSVITDNDFPTEVMEASQPVVAYFWANWCGPCRLMSPLMEKVAGEYGDRLKVVKLEIDPNPSAVAQCKVEGVPALRFFNGGEQIASIEGLMTVEKISDFIDQYL